MRCGLSASLSRPGLSFLRCITPGKKTVGTPPWELGADGEARIHGGLNVHAHVPDHLGPEQDWWMRPWG